MIKPMLRKALFGGLAVLIFIPAFASTSSDQIMDQQRTKISNLLAQISQLNDQNAALQTAATQSNAATAAVQQQVSGLMASNAALQNTANAQALQINQLQSKLNISLEVKQKATEIAAISLLAALVLGIVFGRLSVRRAPLRLQGEGHQAKERDHKAVSGEDVMASKLDLAHAYLSMENDRGAYQVLQSVQARGNPAQRSEATRLLALIAEKSSKS